MFSSLLQTYLCLVHIKKSSMSLETSSVKHGRIFPISPPSFLLLQHKPSQENNKQMSGMGTVPRESSQVLKKAGIISLVPRLEGRRQASAWLSESLSKTRKTWQKSPLPVTSIPKLLAAHTLPQVWTHKSRNCEKKKLFLQRNHQHGLGVLSFALWVVLRQENSTKGGYGCLRGIVQLDNFRQWWILPGFGPRPMPE